MKYLAKFENDGEGCSMLVAKGLNKFEEVFEADSLESAITQAQNYEQNHDLDLILPLIPIE